MRKEQFERAFINNLNLKNKEKFRFESKCSMRKHNTTSKNILIGQVGNFYYHLANNLLEENTHKLNILYVGDRDYCCTYLALILGFMSADTTRQFSYTFVGDFCKKVLEGNDFDLSKATFVSTLDDIPKDQKYDVVYGNMCGATHNPISKIYIDFVDYISDNALVIFSCLGRLDLWGCSLASSIYDLHWDNIYKYFCSHNMYELSDCILIYDKLNTHCQDKSEKILIKPDEDNIKFANTMYRKKDDPKGSPCYCLDIQNDLIYCDKCSWNTCDDCTRYYHFLS